MSLNQNVYCLSYRALCINCSLSCSFYCVYIIVVFGVFFLCCIVCYYLSQMHNKMLVSRLTIGHLNINGIKSKVRNKLEDPILQNKINLCHIMCLSETHATQGDTFSVENYSAHSLVRKKHKRARKGSGGLLILIKKAITKGVHVEHINSNFVWVTLNKRFFQLSSDIHVAFVYASPKSSTHNTNPETDIMELLESEITTKTQSGTVMIMGDLNARTGDLQDIIINNSSNGLVNDFEDLHDDSTFPTRRNSDKIVCGRGRQLAELCTTANLFIANGRALGDSFGELTCHKYNGSSAVDYLCVSHDLWSNVIYFKVHEFDGTLSDHCMISTALNVRTCNQVTDTNNLHPAPQRYKWNVHSKELFLKALQSADFAGPFCQTADDINNPSLPTNISATSISNILLQVNFSSTYFVAPLFGCDLGEFCTERCNLYIYLHELRSPSKL